MSGMMRVVAAAMLAACWVQGAEAAFFGLPRVLKAEVARLEAEEPTLPPSAHTRFCIRNPHECRPTRMVFRPLRLAGERWAELVRINAAVNHSIRPERKADDPLDQSWSIAPVAGASYDFAVTKRHELVARGWPARALLLAEVAGFGAGREVVLLVRAREGDYVADSAASAVRPRAATTYRFVRMQCPADPWFWDSVKGSAI